MKSVRLMCVSAMAGFGLLAMPLGLAPQQQQEDQQQHPRLTISNGSESRYSTTSSNAPQNRIDGGPAGPGFRSSTTAVGTVDYLDEGIWPLSDAEPSVLTGNCEYICGSIRCPELTGWCKGVVGSACRAARDLRNCPPGRPAIRPGSNACGYGVDTARRCTP
jgi:hypothetical protein